MILPLLLLMLVATSRGCVFEIRDVVFYPNGSQEVARDWVIVDFRNQYGYDLFDVEIGDIAKVPVVRKGEEVRIDPYKNLSPREFPLSITASVKTFQERGEIEYTVRNLGNGTEVEVRIPVFRDLISCGNCEISSGIVIFRKSLEKNETANFTLITSRQFSVPDGTVSFSYEDSLNLNFTANIPVSVEKSKSDSWIGIFKVTNTLDREIDLKMVAFVEFQDGSRNELFERYERLGAGESFTKSVEVQSNDVPIFLFKVQARVSDFCKLTMVPAYEVDGRHVVGQALLKGLGSSFTPSYPSGVWRGALPAQVTLTPPSTPETTATPPAEFGGFRPQVFIPPLKIPELLLSPYFTVFSLSFAGFFFVLVFPVRARRGIVAMREHENIARLFARRFRIYCPPSSPIGYGIVVEPDEELVSVLIESGIPRKYAESVAVAAKVKKPLIVDREEVAKIALSIGIPVIMYGKPGRAL